MRVFFEVLANLFRRPFTFRYPKKVLRPFHRFRGRISFYPEKCIGCKLCERYCPVKAVKFNKKGDINFDLGLCIYCGLCQDVCPTSPKSIILVEDFEFAGKEKKSLKEIRKP